MRRFARFACIDWSGAAGPLQKGIALAIAEAGDAAPILLAAPGRGWSRQAALDWLLGHAAARSDLLIGVDFSAALPFDAAHGYLPGVADVPRTARAFWDDLDARCAGDPHLSVGSFLATPEIARLFRIGAVTGAGFGGDGGACGDRNGRLRAVERRVESGRPASCFNLVGARQVGRSSLTGMRVLARLAGAVPVWPFDPVPRRGPLIVEVYTSIAATAAGRSVGATKMRTGAALDAALVHPAIASAPTGRVSPIDDHGSDALLTAAWMRRAACEPMLWMMPPPAIADTEGWTFGVPWTMAAAAPA